MQAITNISGKAIPLAMDDVDTDLIIPAQYLTSVDKQGYGENLFRRLKENPDFVFNQEKYKDAPILISGANFGCGSSREHAVWALQQAGIAVVIASSFGDIFYSNSAKNGLLLIKLSEAIINDMLQKAKNEAYILNIDIENQKITSNKNEEFNFEMDPFRKHCFLNGLDDLDYLLSFKDKIAEFDRE